MTTQNPFFISCKECRKETPRSFYGCFYLGPFKASQSLTIANDLRRTLLSEIDGCAITSVYIEGVDHEYSVLPGIRETVLDILLNLKEVVFKVVLSSLSRTTRIPMDSTSCLFPSEKAPAVFGYLQARGPGIVRASDLKLPAGLQCVDPDQYLATLSHDGNLNLKFIVTQGEYFQAQNPKLVYQENKPFDVLNSKLPLCIDPVFMCVDKVNYTIESSLSISNHKSINRGVPVAFTERIGLRDSHFLEEREANLKEYGGSKGSPQVKVTNQEYNKFHNLSLHQKSGYNHVVMLEIWTNGSIHPREALSEALKKLLCLFSSLNQMNLVESTLAQYIKKSKRNIKNKN